jgi:hypothetical protein
MYMYICIYIYITAVRLDVEGSSALVKAALWSRVGTTDSGLGGGAYVEYLMLKGNIYTNRGKGVLLEIIDVFNSQREVAVPSFIML